MKKKVFFLSILFILIFMGNNYAKYVIEYTDTVAEITIDRVIPKVEMINIITTNTNLQKWINNTHDVIIKIYVMEKNIKINNFNTENVKVLVGGKETIPSKFDIKFEAKWGIVKAYALYLSGIEGDGKLEIKIPEGTIVDIAENVNKETIIDTGITVDNAVSIVISTPEE